MKLPTIETFTAIADKYGNSINTTQDAERFFDEFMSLTGGQINIDFLDCDNEDRLKKVAFDHDKGLMVLYRRLPEADEDIRMVRKSVLPFDTYSILIRFHNVRFVRVKDGKCIAVVINGYTMNSKMVETYAKASGNTILKFDEKSSFFTSDMVVKNGDEYEFIRAANTPIVSFWIMPKVVNIQPQHSQKCLYGYNIDSLSQKLEDVWDKLSDVVKTTNDKGRQEEAMKMSGNQMRCLAEGLFKLVMCFYFQKHPFKERNREYNNRMLGDVVGPLKKYVYTTDLDDERLGKMVRVANVLSHDSGLPVEISGLAELYISLKFYISDFKDRVRKSDNKPQKDVVSKLSPQAYIKSNLGVWDFGEEIKSVNNTSVRGCCFRLRINPPFRICNLAAQSDNYLCNDGKIRTLNFDNLSDALVVSNREELIKLEEAILSKIVLACEEQGFDSDGYLVDIQTDMIKYGKPTHLFSLDEIKELMRNADDNMNNRLVIDEDGCPHIIHEIQQGNLYPVSIESWHAGNCYVGAESSLSDAEPSYHLCLKLWLDYLETGCRQYDDCYITIDEMDIKKQLEQYY